MPKSDYDRSRPPIPTRRSTRRCRSAISSMRCRRSPRARWPDVRDGLKPVPPPAAVGDAAAAARSGRAAYKKCARVVGDVMGKYHPARRRLDLRCDGAARPDLLRCATRWSTGRAISAMSTAITPPRCANTEARLTAAAITLMDGLDEDTVAFRPTYNGEEEEPEVFPGLFPNLLANGAAGIAVGMATSIPPHNAAELIDAVVHLIDQPDGDHRRPAPIRPGPRLPDRRHRRRCVRPRSARPMRPAGGSLPHPRALRRAREAGRGHLAARDHRNPLSGASQGQADRADRAADSPTRSCRFWRTSATRATS